MTPDDLAYRGSWSRKAIEVLENATESGSNALAGLVRAMDDRLRRNPVDVGEVYRARGAVEEHLAVYQFLAIDFAVDTNRKFALVRSCNVLM